MKFYTLLLSLFVSINAFSMERVVISDSGSNTKVKSSKKEEKSEGIEKAASGKKIKSSRKSSRSKEDVKINLEQIFTNAAQGSFVSFDEQSLSSTFRGNSANRSIKKDYPAMTLKSIKGDKEVTEEDFLREIQEEFGKAEKDNNFTKILFLKHKVDLYVQLKQKNNIEELFKKEGRANKTENLIMSFGVLLGTIIAIVLTEVLTNTFIGS